MLRYSYKTGKFSICHDGSTGDIELNFSPTFYSFKLAVMQIFQLIKPILTNAIQYVSSGGFTEFINSFRSLQMLIYVSYFHGEIKCQQT